MDMGPGRPPDFLIVGTPRSGTTLVQRLASELQGVRVPPETHFLRLFVPGLMRRRRFPIAEAELIEELERYAALDDVRGIGIEPRLVAHRLGGRARSVVELFGAIVRQLAGEAVLYGEKTPSHLRWWRELTAACPDLKLIGVVRDPRAVVASYFEAWPKRPHSVLAERWAIDQRMLLDARSTLGPGRCVLLSYEDVVTDPDTARRTLSELLGHPGESHDAPQELHLDWEEWKRHCTGPITAERIASWRDSLPRGTAAEIATIAEREMELFGYDDHGPAARVSARDRWRCLRYRLERRVEDARRARLARRGDFGCECG